MTLALAVVTIAAAVACPLHMLWRYRRREANAEAGRDRVASKL